MISIRGQKTGKLGKLKFSQAKYSPAGISIDYLCSFRALPLLSLPSFSCFLCFFSLLSFLFSRGWGSFSIQLGECYE